MSTLDSYSYSEYKIPGRSPALFAADGAIISNADGMEAM
jgi:hypothetical protein